ncbi:MAG: CCA tRNA nucleotidyltransferase [Planctomycetota bacterium]|nr:CCA tRNA nucleotidyltransferase [Planctomycetota bacterium]
MRSPQPDPVASREFAASVVSRLRGAGHETYWAGGCVRDELLGRTPADYDVATAARPEEVRAVFGRSRTLAVGAAFGVITVLGPKAAGQIEVATFRADAAYTDGRHPAGVTFCSAREDAKRRDFTINGLFLDPVSGEVHDFVGGRDDLAAGIVRAIGVPAMRFGEDHLRMLRAVRFTAFFDFVLEAETRRAIERMGHLVVSVSPERIAAELRAMVSRTGRRRALELLLDTGLAGEVLPEVAPRAGDSAGQRAWAVAAAVIGGLDEPVLPQALATLAAADEPATLGHITDRLRLSNQDSKATGWLHAAIRAIGSASDLARRPWSHVQPWVADPRAPLLADLLRARAGQGQGDAEAAAWFTAQTERPQFEVDPPPLVTGSDLLAAGVPAGPAVGAALARVRMLQLDGKISSREEAISAVVGLGE